MLAFYNSDARKTSPLKFISPTDMAVFEQHWSATDMYIRLHCPTLYARVLNCMLSLTNRQKFRNFLNRCSLSIEDVIRDTSRTTCQPAFLVAGSSDKGLERQRFCQHIMKKSAAATLDVARLLHMRFGGYCITPSLLSFGVNIRLSGLARVGLNLASSFGLSPALPQRN